MFIEAIKRDRLASNYDGKLLVDDFLENLKPNNNNCKKGYKIRYVFAGSSPALVPELEILNCLCFINPFLLLENMNIFIL